MYQNEQRLIRAAQDGDETALLALYEQHKTAIYTYVYHRVGRRDDIAEEIVSDVFVRMVSNLDNYKPLGKPLLAWLYTIARNRITDHYRAVGRANESEITGFERDSTPSPEAQVAQNLQMAQVQDALGNLTDPQRDVLILRFMNEMSVNETAELMNRNEGAIKTLTRRAIAAVQRQLRPEVRYG